MDNIILNNEKQKIKMIDPVEMSNAEKKYDDEKIKYKKIKKVCIDIIDSFCECMEKNRVELMVIFYIKFNLFYQF